MNQKPRRIKRNLDKLKFLLDFFYKLSFFFNLVIRFYDCFYIIFEFQFLIKKNVDGLYRW